MDGVRKRARDRQGRQQKGPNMFTCSMSSMERDFGWKDEEDCPAGAIHVVSAGGGERAVSSREDFVCVCPRPLPDRRDRFLLHGVIHPLARLRQEPAH